MQLSNCVIWMACFTAVGVLHCHATDSRTYHTYDDMSSSTNRNSYPSALLCMDIKPQHSVDIQQITGMWYGNEIIMHTQDIPGIQQYNSCVVIHLSDITTQIQNRYNQQHRQYQQHRQQSQHQQHETQSHQSAGDDYADARFLRLIWSEQDNNLEYTFNHTVEAPGLWTNIGEQRGSLAASNQYTQFSGTVQVVKAVSDHLVLTFCGNSIKSSIYTIVLSRTEKGLSAEELRSIRNLLARRGLYTETIRKVCSSAATALQVPTALLIAIIVTLSAFKKFC